jgi:hypothetical protein
VDLIEMESYMGQQVAWCRHVTRLFITLLVSNNTPFHMYSGRACKGWPGGGREHLKRLNIGFQDLTYAGRGIFPHVKLNKVNCSELLRMEITPNATYISAGKTKYFTVCLVVRII